MLNPFYYRFFSLFDEYNLLLLYITSRTCIRWVRLQVHYLHDQTFAWWRHQMETFSALLALYAGNSPVTGDFPSQRPVTRSFHVFFDLHLNKRLSKQSLGWWFETPSCSLLRHCNGRELTISLTLKTKCTHVYYFVVTNCTWVITVVTMTAFPFQCTAI